MMRAAVAAVVLLALTSASAAAQGSSLDTAETRLDRGDYAGARAALDRWWGSPPGQDEDGSRPEHARALLLRARLAGRLEAAEPDYLAIVLGYPSSPYAATALLRLGQGLLAAGTPTRAVEYLERLRRDFPDQDDHGVGALWLVRAHRAAGDPTAACAAARAVIAAVAPGMPARAPLEREAEAACADAPPAGARESAGPSAAADADAQQDRPAATGRFSVQTGAFRYERGADALAARLRRAGYSPRLVYVPDSPLLRVRVGRFPGAADAERLARRLRADGFATAVVRNAHHERAR